MNKEIEQKLSELPDDYVRAIVEKYIANQKEEGRRLGIQQALDALVLLHGRALGKHNYYANAYAEIKKLRKRTNESNS